MVPDNEKESDDRTSREEAKSRRDAFERERRGQLAKSLPPVKAPSMVRKVLLWENGTARQAKRETAIPEKVGEAETLPEDTKDPTGTEGHDVGTPAGRRRRRRVLIKLRSSEWGWGQYHGSLWWVLAGLSCIGLLGFYLYTAVTPRAEGKPLPSPYRPPPLSGIEGSPIEMLVNQSAELLPVLADLVAKAQAPTGKGSADLFRGGEEGRTKRRDWNQRVEKPADFDLSAPHQLHASVVAKTPYLYLKGTRLDHTPGSIYFVEEEGRYLIDWEATEGYSEVLPQEVADLADREPRLMRCLLMETVFHRAEGYPEDAFLCVTLHHRDRNTFLWAYAPMGSSQEKLITEYLTRKPAGVSERPVTLKVRKGAVSGTGNQVEIVEFHHWEWVAPEEPAPPISPPSRNVEK